MSEPAGGSAWPSGELTPRPGAAPLLRMLTAQTLTELRLTLRRGESVLLTLVIPLMLLVILVRTSIVDIGAAAAGGSRAGFFVPGVVALAVMSSAFTGQAIATGYERQYGVLKRLGATALPRAVLLAAKTIGVLGVELVQTAAVLAVGLALGWRPHGSGLAVLGLVVLATAAFSGLGLLMAGTLRAEVTLAGANLVWFLLLIFGGVIFPLTTFSPNVRHALQLLPTAALADGLRDVLRFGASAPVHDILTLAAWALATLVLAAVTFRWE